MAPRRKNRFNQCQSRIVNQHGNNYEDSDFAAAVAASLASATTNPGAQSRMEADLAEAVARSEASQREEAALAELMMLTTEDPALEAPWVRDELRALLATSSSSHQAGVKEAEVQAHAAGRCPDQRRPDAECTRGLDAKEMVLKVVCGQDIRRLTASWTSFNDAFDAIVAAVRDGFQLGQNEELILKYADDTEDMCTLAAATVRDALTFAEGKIIKFHLEMTQCQRGDSFPTQAAPPATERCYLGKFARSVAPLAARHTSDTAGPTRGAELVPLALDESDDENGAEEKAQSPDPYELDDDAWAMLEEVTLDVALL